jgi:uncharacterized membrane protein YphA (DoxX/SURF4 family)
MSSEARVEQAWWTLRIGLGLMAVFAGADKFTNLLTNWAMYLNPVVPRLTHLAPTTLMHLVGIVEFGVGVLVLSGRGTRWGAYIVMLWLWGIALNLATQGMYFDIAVRDIELSLAAFVLARLTEVLEQAVAPHRASAYQPQSKAVA